MDLWMKYPLQALNYRLPMPCKQTIKLQTDYMLVYQQQKDLRQVCVPN